jgi:methyl-accepting chemotaxis protein
MRLLNLSLKWKIFAGCFWLSTAIVVGSIVYSNHMARRAASLQTNEMPGALRRYLAYQAAVSRGMAAAVDVWATSMRLADALQKNDDKTTNELLASVEERLAGSIRPDFVVILDPDKGLYRSADCPIRESHARTMRLFADLKQGISMDSRVLSLDRRAYLITGEPVQRDGQVLGAVLIGVHLDRLFADFKGQSDTEPKRQIDIALIQNQHVTGASLPSSEWPLLAAAARPDAVETTEEMGRRVRTIRLGDMRHDFHNEELTGYDGDLMGSVGRLYALRDRTVGEANLQALVRDNAVVAIFALIIATVVSWSLSVLITRPLRQFIAATDNLARGAGDLTQRIHVHSSATEIRALADNLNAMFAHLEKLVSEVQGASLQVGASSAEISAASKQMLSGASSQAQRIESSTAAVTELSSSIQQVAENAAQASQVAKERGEALSQGMARLDETSRLIATTADKIQELGKSGRRIGNIVEVIRQISEQTSLLALNASIEAAHAGEQGRGFAVVADEVSSLARRVGQSAKDIELLIAAITEQTAEAVSSMQNVTRAFGEQITTASSMQQALQRIVHTVDDTARAVQEQAVVSDEIARNMDAVRKIAQEVLASSEEAVVQGDQLHGLAVRLEQLVACFNLADGEDAAPSALPPVAAPALPARSSERRRVARG